MFITQQNILYQGDMAIGDREATEAEVAAYIAARTPDPKDAIRAQIKQMEQAQIKQMEQAQIKQMEQAQLMPRATREFMLLFMESSFTPAQLAQNIGYAGIKAFDNQITALRNQL